MLKKASTSLYINLFGISWPRVSHSINLFSYETPKNTEEDPDDPESADEGNIQMKYSLDYLYSLKVAAVTENYL